MNHRGQFSADSLRFNSVYAGSLFHLLLLLEKCRRLCSRLLGSRAGAEEEEDEEWGWGRRRVCVHAWGSWGRIEHTPREGTRKTTRETQTRLTEGVQLLAEAAHNSGVQSSQRLLKLPYGSWTRPAVPSPTGWWAAVSHGNFYTRVQKVNAQKCIHFVGQMRTHTHTHSLTFFATANIPYRMRAEQWPDGKMGNQLSSG